MNNAWSCDGCPFENKRTEPTFTRQDFIGCLALLLCVLYPSRFDSRPDMDLVGAHLEMWAAGAMRGQDRAEYCQSEDHRLFDPVYY